MHKQGPQHQQQLGPADEVGKLAWQVQVAKYFLGVIEGAKLIEAQFDKHRGEQHLKNSGNDVTDG